MNRFDAREITVQLIYALDFTQDIDDLCRERTDPVFYEGLREECSLYKSPPEAEDSAYITGLARGVAEHITELDGYIEKYAEGWKFGRIPRVAVAIMRVCMYEVLYCPDVPDRAAINAAVEISKHYEPAEVSSFINGILGSFIRTEKQIHDEPESS